MPDTPSIPEIDEAHMRMVMDVRTVGVNVSPLVELTDAQWIAANIKLLAQMTPEAYFTALLATLRATMTGPLA